MSEGTWEKLSQVAVKGAEHDSRERQPHPKCLEGTRVAVLTHIYELLDKKDKNQLIWLHGTAGVGKSAVAFTVAERMKDLKMTEDTKIETRLAGTFFFSRKHTKRRTTGYFFATLAYQLAINFPSVRKDVNRAILDNPALLDPDKSLRDQMKGLFLQPLRNLQIRLRECPPLAFIVDALDECTPESLDQSTSESSDEDTSESELADLISLLAQALRDPGLPVTHILVTSRSEAHIHEAMHNEDVWPLVCEIPVNIFGEGVAATISLDGADVDEDIYRFLEHSFRKLGSRCSTFPQPTEGQLARLASRAGRRFIVASTMMKFIDDRHSDPRDRLQLMLELTSELLPGTEVYKLYDRILSTCADPSLAYLHLSVVCALADPLPMSQIATLLGPSQGRDIERVLVQLRSVIEIPTDSSLPVNIYHSSVRDYVSHRSNCTLRQVQYIASPHSLLAVSSLHLMIQDIPDRSALLDALSALNRHSQAMESHDPQSLAHSLSFMEQPPEPIQVLITLLWLRGNRQSELQFWLETLDGHAWLATRGGNDWLQTQGRAGWLQTQGGGGWLQTQGGEDWLRTRDGKDWLQTQGGEDWLRTWGGGDWLQTQDGQAWLQTQGGQDWLQTQGGKYWLRTQGGRDWLQTQGGKDWLQTQGGRVWLQTQGGKDWLQTWDGRVWLWIHGGEDWLQTESGEDWLQTQDGKDWLQSWHGLNWLQTQGGKDWLQTQGGKNWLQTQGGEDWLRTPDGKDWLQIWGAENWLRTQGGKDWLQTQGGKDWLWMQGGKNWLRTQGGKYWLQTEGGEDWLQTQDGDDWLQSWHGVNWLQTQGGRVWLRTWRGDKWLQTQGGRVWLRTQNGRVWLKTQDGRVWLQTQGGENWLQIQGREDWLQTQDGQDWLQTQGGEDWLRTWGGEDWLQTQDGQDWLQTQGGKDWLRTWGGENWLQTQGGKDWRQTRDGKDWQMTQDEQYWQQTIHLEQRRRFYDVCWPTNLNSEYKSGNGIDDIWVRTESSSWVDWLQTSNGQDWLKTVRGRHWLQTQAGTDWLQFQGGSSWLQSPGGRDWLQSKGGGNWLQSKGGRDWLQTKGGRDWLQTKDGRDWLQTSRGQTWRLTVTMEEFSNTWEAIREYIITPGLPLLPAFQVIQQFKTLPDFLMFPAFLALRHQDHPTSALPQGRRPRMEVIRAVEAFSSFAYDAHNQSLTASDALIYACQNWAVHLSRAPNPWNERLAHIFKTFWNHHLLSWLERQWCLKDLPSCLAILSEGQKLATEHLIHAPGSSQ